MIPVQYFQVAAAAIPTLLIAVAVGAKQGQQMWDAVKGAKGFDRFMRVTWPLVLTVIVLGGEISALGGTVTNGGGGLQASIAFMAIVVLLYTIALELVAPMRSQLSKREDSAVMW